MAMPVNKRVGGEAQRLPLRVNVGHLCDWPSLNAKKGSLLILKPALCRVDRSKEFRKIQWIYLDAALMLS
jgi:hypothetical protein